MRAYHWANTALGSVEHWSSSLKTTLNLLFSVQQPTLLVWGAESVQFYNDAYQSLMGLSQPLFSLHSFKENGSNVPDQISTTLEQVWETGQPIHYCHQAVLLKRHGHLKEHYLSGSFSAICEEGKVVGVWATLFETTEQVLCDRRLRLLQDLNRFPILKPSHDEITSHVLEAIASNSGDIPFALLYQINAARSEAVLTGVTGVKPETPLSPAQIDLTGSCSSFWDLATVSLTGQAQHIMTLEEPLAQLLTGNWFVTPSSAMLLPLWNASQELIGFLILGINPNLPFDAAYQDFFALLAKHVSSAIAPLDIPTVSSEQATMPNNVLEQITDAFVALDQEWRYTYVNQVAAHLLGYSPAALIGKRLWQDVFTADQDSPVAIQLRQAMAAQVPLHTEAFLPVLDRYIKVSAYPSVEGMSIYFRDVSQHKQMEEDLHASESQFRQLAENMEDAFWIAEIQEGYRVLYVSPDYERIWGRSCEQLYANPYDWLEVVHPDERDYVRTGFTEQIASGRFDAEFRIIRADGSVRWIRDRGFPIQEENGQVRRIAGIAEDITARKHVEQALYQQQQELRLITDAVPAVITYVDRQQRYRFVNKAFTQWFRVTAEQVIGRSVAEFMGETIYAFMQQDIEAVLAGQVVSVERWMPFEAKARYVRRQYIPNIEADGTVNGFYALITDLTDLKQTEEALRQSEERYRSLVSLLTSIVWRIDAEGQFVLPQPSWQSFTGQSQSEYQGWGWLQAIHRDDRDRIKELWIQARDARLIFRADGRIWHAASHRYHYFEARGVPLCNADGSVREWVGTITDIDDRKHAEAALRQSEERFRQLAENIEDVFWIMDIQDEKVLYISPACEQSWGCSQESLIANPKSWLEAVYPDDRQRVEAEFLNYALNRRFVQEYRIVHPDGSLRWIRNRSFPIHEENGRIQRLAGIAEDITDRKLTAEALRDSEERFRLAARAVTGIVYDWDVQAGVVYRSEGLHDLIGLHPDQVPEGRDWWSERLHPDDLARIQPIMMAVLAGESDRYDFEYRIRHQDGRWVTVWDRGYLIRNPQGQTVRVVGSTADISDRKQAEADREQLLAREQAARAEAEKANRIKDEFLAVLSHELRSPLNPILGWATLLQRRKVNEATLSQALETIQRNVKLQVQLIDDLLDVSRILRGKLNLETGSVNLVPTILAAIETVRLAAEAKSIQIETQLVDNLWVLGDAGRLQQVVWNLLSNAVKFTPTGGQVTVRLQAVGAEARIQVQDNGKGISPTFLPHVFEYFRQEDGTTTRKFGGLGLGLAIVRYLTEMHGGIVMVDSLGEGKGATFTVKLPLLSLAEQLESQDLTPAHARPEDALAPLQGVQVLVVEDVADTQDLIVFFLKQAGAVATAVSSAAEGLEFLTQSVPDIIISDIGMPEIDGYMFMRQLRSRPPEQGGTVPAIALTAYAGDSDAEKARLAGFQKHIPKPIEPYRLIQAIVELI
ncbi:MAG: hypothetical protein Kow00121_57940 [Elainellaceae cyanobacterium]